MLRVAFASTDRAKVNQHFGSAEGFASTTSAGIPLP